MEKKNVDPALDEALRHHQAGRLDLATPIYQEILSVVPEHARALHLLGIAEHQAGRHAEAIELMERAIRQTPERAELFNDLAQAHLASNRLGEATNACRRAVELRADYLDARLCLATLLLEAGGFDEAILHFQRAVSLVPDLPDAHFGLGNAMAQGGREDEAIASYETALTLAPEFLGARVNLGHTLKARGDFEAATLHYREALALSPDSASIHASLGEALVSLGALEDAVASYECALAIDADLEGLSAGLQTIGYRAQAEGQFELAARAFAHLMRTPAPDHAAAAMVHADRMTYAVPERFNPDILRIASVDDVVSTDEIARLATIASKFDLISGGIETNRLLDQHVRQSKVRWLKRTPDTYWIYTRLMERVLELNDGCWRFDINLMSDEIQYGEYGEGGHYTWHLDLGNDKLSNRKLSFSVQLSDPDEYDGGELEFRIADATMVAPRTRGALVVFPSFLMHRVAPVTRGVRRSLVGWISGTNPYR